MEDEFGVEQAAPTNTGFEGGFDGGDAFEAPAQHSSSSSNFGEQEFDAPVAAPVVITTTTTNSSHSNSSSHSSSSSSAAASTTPSPLIAINAKIRDANEAKDAIERDAKAARKAAGAAAVKTMLAERSTANTARFAKNRADEKAKVGGASVAGEAWARVGQLIDVHPASSSNASSSSASAAGGHHASSSSSHASGGHGHSDSNSSSAASKKGKGSEGGDTGRMKEVLIAVKNHPPPVAPNA